MKTPSFYKVAVNAPLAEPLLYLLPSKGDSPKRGDSVIVPLGSRNTTGVVLGFADTNAGNYLLKEIIQINKERPRLKDPFLSWLEWLSEYYLHPIGLVMEMAFPPKSHRKRKIKSKKNPVLKEYSKSSLPDLTFEQNQVLEQISVQEQFKVHLLHGVTGSGKSEVYLRLLDETIKQGKKGLVLVPEISLTPQLVERFTRRFGSACALLHSHLTPMEKTEQWWSIVEEKKQILIGARSALFCPIPNLGIIIIDEEHESSFKQDSQLRYHARDAAIMLAKMAQFPIVLGSATPSLESWARAQEGRYHLLQMKERVANRSLPNISVIDLRAERRKNREDEVESHFAPQRLPLEKSLPFWMSKQLYHSLLKALSAKEQGALFLNRRGLAQLALCRSCGFKKECPHCAISLTLHHGKHLVCHYCDYNEQLSTQCSSCLSGEIQPLGMGTELLEKDIKQLFPQARVARADRDEITGREELEELIRKVEQREIDILIGTQMIAKGLDFPGLTLVGLVMADVGFSLPDFRAGERSFQILTQMAGRAGRHSLHPGAVFIQTYNPNHPSITFTCDHDYSGFAEKELEIRKELNYPPFCRLALLRMQSSQLQQTEMTAKKLKSILELIQTQHPTFAALEWLGPAPAPILKLRNKYRFQLLIKSPDPGHLKTFCKQIIYNKKWIPRGVELIIDIDPINMI
ncbi:MAG: primosomal protein N' [Bdellovibrionales bacterium]|nr:primosomal protein N' [Bdellovibrionales bacterium]